MRFGISVTSRIEPKFLRTLRRPLNVVVVLMPAPDRCSRDCGPLDPVPEGFRAPVQNADHQPSALGTFARFLFRFRNTPRTAQAR
jgi:hypothetical protein